MSILIAIITGALIGIFAAFMGGFIVNRVVSREKQAFAARWNSFFTPGKDKPSPFADLVQEVADTFGNRVAISLKASLVGSAGVQAKMKKKMEGAIAVDMVGQAPGVIGMLAQLPQVQGLIESNPKYAGMAMEWLSKNMQNKSNPDNGQSEAVSDFGNF